MKNLILYFLLSVALCSCSNDLTINSPIDTMQDLKLENLVEINSNIPQDFYDDLTFINPNTGFAVSRTGKVVKTSDEGSTWSVLNSAVTFSLQKIQFLTSNVGYIIGGDDTGSFILKTTDSGNSWTTINLNSEVNGSPNSMYFKNELEGFVTGNHLFKKTIDGGATWTNVLNTSDENYQDIKFDDENKIGFVTLNNGNYYKTNNGGLSWQTIDIDISTNNYKDIYFVCNQFLFKNNFDIVNINSKTSTALPNPVFKLLYINSNKIIGIGQHFEEGFFPYGDILLTNNNWTEYSQKSYQPSTEAMNFTAVAKMSSHKTMIIGTGQLNTKIIMLTY